MKALIDGDVLLYRAAFASESSFYILYDKDDKPVYLHSHKKNCLEFAQVYLENGNGRLEKVSLIDEDSFRMCRMIIDSQIKSILRRTGATSHTIFLTGEGNYRNDMYADYKANRGGKPTLYSFAKDYLMGKPYVCMVEGMEADDALGIEQYSAYYDSKIEGEAREKSKTIICSIDKDLLMIPGHHYNFVKDETRFILPLAGMRNFYQQLLSGDTVDNIPGLKGIGPKKSEKLLAHCESELEMFRVCQTMWCGEEDSETFYSRMGEMLLSANLLWILREMEDGKPKHYRSPIEET